MRQIRLLSLLQALLMVCLSSHADELTIGTDYYSFGEYPYGTNYTNSTTQTIYTASELGGAKSITAIAFNVAQTSPLETSYVKVYMGHKSASTFYGSYDCMTGDDLTLVYSGSPTLGESIGWETIDLTTPFNYDGHSNLVVAVCRASSTWMGSLAYYCSYGAEMSLSRAGDYWEDYSDIMSRDSYNTQYYRPNIKIIYGAAEDSEFIAEGIKYQVTSPGRVMVMANNYSGVVSIPATVTNKDRSYTVTAIDQEAFYNNSKVTEVIMEGGIESLQYGQFGYCSALSAITIPSSVKTIDTGAFRSCSRLAKITIDSPEIIETARSSYPRMSDLFGSQVSEYIIGSTPTKIGDYAFSRCGMQNVTIGSNITSIGKSAFDYCTGLTSVYLGEKIKEVGEGAFSGCSKLTKAEFASIASLCNIKFGNTSANPLYYAKHLYIDGEEVVSVTVPEGVTELSNSLFAYCASITSISLPTSLTKIGGSAFYNCSALEQINIPQNVTCIDSYAFQNCDALETADYASIATACQIQYYDQWANPMHITGKLIAAGNEVDHIDVPDGITSIGKYSFYNCKNLKSVNLPASVVSIGEQAFGSCENLEEVTLPDNIELIDMRAFAYSGIKSIVIPNSITEIKNGVFSGCKNLQSVHLPDNLQTIGEYAFSYAGLTGISIPASVTSIGSYAFSECTNMEKAEFASLTALCNIDCNGAYSNPLSVAKHLYVNGQEITELTIPDGISQIKANTFEGAEYITKVVLPSSVTSIGNSAFAGCKALASISLPNSLTEIGNKAFYNCTSLTDIVLPESVKSIGSYMLANCTSLKSATLSSGITTIPSYLFENSASLSSVTLGPNVTTISSYAFSGCKSLMSFVVPSSVTSIGNYAFYNCFRLWEIYNLSSLNIEKGKTTNGYVGCYAEVIHTSLDEPTIIKENEFLFTDGNAPVLFGYVGTQKDIVLPDYHNGLAYSIGSYAFYNCTSMESIYIPSTVQAAGSAAFAMCSNLKKAEFQSIEALCSMTFSDASSNPLYLANHLYVKGNEVTELVIPSTVTSIGSYVFSGGKYLTSVVIPASLNSLSSYNSFYGCSNVKNLVYAEGCKYTPATGLTSVENVTIASTVTSISYNAFYNFANLTKIVIPSSVTSINENAFYLCSRLWDVYNLSSLNIVKGSTANGYAAYYAYKVHTSLSEPLAVNGVGDYYFTDATETEPACLVAYVGSDIDIVLPADYKGEGYDIGKSAFSTNKSLHSVKMPYGVKNIGEYAFYNCAALESLKLPDSIENIERYAFSGTSIKDLVIPNGIKTLNQGMSSSDATVYVPASVSYVYRSTSLQTAKEAVFEDGEGKVTFQDRNASDGYYTSALDGIEDIYIGKNALGDGFSYAGELFSSNLKSMTFGPQVTSAFNNYYNMRRADKLTTVTCLSKTPFECPQFYGTPTVNVPLGSGDAYMADGGWSGYTIKEVTSVKVRMTETVMTYTPDFDIDFTDVEGIKAFAFESAADGEVILKPVYKVMAGQGVILKGVPGSYTVPCDTIDGQMDDECPLKGTISGTYISNSGEGSTAYYLAVENGEPVFLPVTVHYGMQLKRNQAYISLPWAAERVGVFFVEPIDADIKDATEYDNARAQLCSTLTYTRDFTSTAWQALYVPFAMQYSDWCEEFDVAELNNFHEYDDDYDGVTDRTELEVKMMKDGSTVDPNVPYLIRAKAEGEKTMTFANATLYASEENTVDCASLKTRYMFTGTYSSLSAEELNGCYAMSGGMLQPIVAGASLKPMRWYLKMETRNGKTFSARQIKIRVVDAVTDGIEEIEDRELESDSSAYYNVAGQRVAKNSAKRGSLLIVKGKKFINR